MIGCLNGQFYSISVRKKPRKDGTMLNYAPISREAGQRGLRETLLGYSIPINCQHGTKVFNGYVWRCKECGEVLN